MDAWRNQYLPLLKTHFMADPRKSVALAVLSVVMAVVWVRALNTSKKPGVDAAVKIAEGLLSPAVAVAEGPLAALAVADPVEAATRLTEAVSIEGATRTLARDPFAADWSLFRSARPAQMASEGQAPRPSFWTLLRDQARAERERQARRTAAVRQAAAALKLQSTIAGAAPAAMISDALVRPGDRIGGFEVVEIGERTVVVRKEGVRVTLRMP